MVEVSKKFRKGELFDSLRDALPALATKLVGWPKRGAPSSREFWALKDISLSVERGEVLGIIGHNGAGKSTILKLLSGVLKPTAGTIAVNGSLSALIEIGAGFHPDLTGRENIFLNGAILGLSRARVRQKFDEIVEFSGLAEFLDTPVKRYSTGMYARLGFSVAAHADPDILLVDEVLSVGDYSFQNKCMERMREIVEQGSAIVFVSHNLSAVANFCNRAILLGHGHVVADGPPEAVIAAYLGNEHRSVRPTHSREAYVSRFVIRDENSPRRLFTSGDDAWVEIDVTATKPCEKLSVGLFMKDDRAIDVFNTSSERLKHPSFSLGAFETKTLRFRLKLHLVNGAFHLGANVYRYDIQKLYDEPFPLGTLVVNCANDVRGVVNLYPEIDEGTTLREVSFPRSVPCEDDAPSERQSPKCDVINSCRDTTRQ
jgi:lipopolysaccharide transport system ATP-binding protein